MKRYILIALLCCAWLFTFGYWKSQNGYSKRLKEQGTHGVAITVPQLEYEGPTFAEGLESDIESNQIDNQSFTGSMQPMETSRHRAKHTDLPDDLSLPTDVASSIEILTRSGEIEQRFEALLTLAALKADHGDAIEEAITMAIMSGQIIGRELQDAIEIVGIESSVINGKLIDWMMQLDNVEQRTAIVAVINELDLDANQQAIVPEILRGWQQSSSEDLRNAVAEVAIHAEYSDSALINAALADSSIRVRFTMLSAMQASGKDWSELSDILEAISNDRMLPAELRRMSRRML